MDEALRQARLAAIGVVLWQTRTVEDVAAAPNSVVASAPLLVRNEASPVAEDSFGPMYDAEAEPLADADNEPHFDIDMASRSGAGDGLTRHLPVELAASLLALQAQVSACKSCGLHQSRKQTVFGSGDESARLLVIGEAPGADEDAQGAPFVGPAGKLLNAMLLGIGLSREEVYVTNILKCKPPRNRDPQLEEVASCGPYLQQQIAFVAPQLILAVGRIAAQRLLGVLTPIGKLRGSTHTHPASGIPVLVTYHPAYLLRSPIEKRRAWQDLKQVAVHLEQAR